MAKFIAIGGEPATGKSSIMKVIIGNLEEQKKAFIGNMFGLPVTLFGNILIIGFYEKDETFGGTDRLPMNVQPIAEEFVKKVTGDYVVVFEGDRLFNEKFLNAIISARHRLQTFVIECKRSEIKRRHQLRDNQDETWLMGRTTKIWNIMRHNEFMEDRYSLTVLDNSTEDRLEKNAMAILLSFFT